MVFYITQDDEYFGLMFSRITSPKNTRTSKWIDQSAGGFLCITFWKKEAMDSSQEAMVMLLNLRELGGMKLTQPD